MYAAVAALLAATAVTACAPVDNSENTEPSTEYATPLDLAKARADCLRSKGWTVELDEESAQFAIQTTTDEEQVQLEADDKACFDELGVDPNRTLTPEEFDTLYEQYQDGAKCLRENGFEISTAPSRQVFSETYYTDPWLPWSQVDDTSFDDALESCPMPPPVL